MHKLSHSKRYAARWILLSCLLIILTITVGCDEDALTSNDVLPVLDPDSTFGDPSVMDSLITIGSLSIYSGSQLVSPDSGGTVSFQVGSSFHEFTVPAGALAQQTDVSVAVRIMDTTKLSLLIDFQPDGLQFIKPAEIKIRYPNTGIVLGSFYLYWHNPTLGTWEYNTSAKVDSLGFISFPISHFSKYGVSN